MDVSIVVVSYNVRKLLERCLESLVDRNPVVGASGSLEVEVYVVDNASEDGSVAMVRSKFPTVRLIENTENRGFAAANNQAFAETRGRYVWMLNPDTVVCAGALEALVSFMDAHSRAGACGGRLVKSNGEFQHGAFRFPTLAQIFLDFFPISRRVTDSRLNGRYSRAGYARGKPFHVDHPLGADLLVRRQAAEQVGWLDERFFIYCEEIDWCLRMRNAHWEVWCVPAATIVHHEAQSTGQFRDAMFVELWKARARLFDKHYSAPFRRIARWIVRAGLWNSARRTRAELRRGLVTQDEAERRLAAFARVGALLG